MLTKNNSFLALTYGSIYDILKVVLEVLSAGVTVIIVKSQTKRYFDMEHKLIEITQNDWSDNSLRLILTPSNYAKNNLFYIQEIGFFETAKNYYVKRENLSSFLILQTLEGSGILGYMGEEYLLSAGDVFFIDCRKEHFYHITGNKPWVFNWIHFKGGSSSEYCQSFIRHNSGPVMRIDVNELDGIFKSLLNINSVVQNTNEILSSLKITEMLTLLTLYGQILHSEVCSSNDIIDKAVWYIEKHLHENLSLESISKQFNMNKYSFHKLFKQYTNTPLNEFIILQRISYAKELLRSSNMSVKEVGEAVGISNISHFINLFKSREGVTPLKYKHKWN